MIDENHFLPRSIDQSPRHQMAGTNAREFIGRNVPIKRSGSWIRSTGRRRYRCYDVSGVTDEITGGRFFILIRGALEVAVDGVHRWIAIFKQIRI